MEHLTAPTAQASSENADPTAAAYVEQLMDRLALQSGESDRGVLAVQAAVDLATQLLRARQVLQQATAGLDRLNALTGQRAALLHLTDAWLKDREAFCGEKRLRSLLRRQESDPGPKLDSGEAFHHN